jgi:tetratricopeptide (TPR) repeat protein
MTAEEQKDALYCVGPPWHWPVQRFSRYSIGKRGVIFGVRMEWLPPEDLLLAISAEDTKGQRAGYEVTPGSRRSGEDVRRERRFRTTTWRFRAIGREWEQAEYLYPSPDGTGTFLFAFCVDRSTDVEAVRSAFFEMLDSFEPATRKGLDPAIERGRDLESAITDWRSILDPSDVPSRLRPAREKAIAAIRSAPGSDNSFRASAAIGRLLSYNDQGVLLGSGYSAADVVLNMDRASKLSPDGRIPYDDCFGRALLDVGENDRAVAILEVRLKRMNKDERSWFNLGEAYRAKGEKEKAIAAYGEARKAVEESRRMTAPGSTERLRYLGELDKSINERVAEMSR